MSVIIAMSLYALSMSISPGPVNIITLSNGVNHGFKKTIPFILGAVIGFNTILVLMGIGLGQIIANNESFLLLLSYGGTAFICYMGYKISISTKEIMVTDKDHPSFFQGITLNLLNPKAWVASLVGVGAFNLVGSYKQLILFVSLYFIIQCVSVSAWGLAGDKISDFLKNKKNLKIFNIIMGSSLIVVAFNLFYLQISN